MAMWPALVNAQAKLVETVESKKGEVNIPYTRYVLPNGLTIILHEDHSDPIVHVDVTYHVGSAREEIGKSGFAHFFEHMMFQGSDNVADEQHFKIITEAGGTLNGTTNRDRTNYFETVPSNQLEKMLWLESDRMGFLLDAVTQKKFENQRSTVKNERGQNYDNKPYGLVSEFLSKNLYPYGHPYSWLTIGYVEDLNRVDVNDLKNFFLRWYGPNNAVLTVGGDIDVKQTLAMIEKYFGSIPMGVAVTPTVLPPFTIDKERSVSMTDNYAKNPMLAAAMPTVPANHKDELALDCLANIIGGDNNSILYQNLVKSNRATSASCFNSTSELAGTFEFRIVPSKTESLAKMEEALREAVAEFMRKGVSDDDITKFKNAQEAQLIYSLESVSGKVSRLAYFYTFVKDANYITKQLAELRALTKQDVINAYNKYIKEKPMVVVNVLTKDMVATNGNYTVDESKNVYPTVNYSGLTYNKAKDNFDRSKMPAAGPNPSIKKPIISVVNIGKNKLKLLSIDTKELPVIYFKVSMKGGRGIEGENLSKRGLVSLFTKMMDEDTKNYSAEQFSVMMDKLGCEIYVGGTDDEFYIAMKTLKKNFDASMQLFEERLLQPLFLQDNLDRFKMQTISSLKNVKTNASAMANLAVNRINFGEDSYRGYLGSGSEKTLENISLADIEGVYKNYFKSSNTNISVVGDISKTEIDAIVSTVSKLPSDIKTKTTIAQEYKNKVKANTVYVINIPKAAQSEVRVGYITGMPYDATGDYYKSTLMNYPLGGAFNSRINLNLREDKGWTYGARTGFNSNVGVGTWGFSAGVRSNTTDSTIVEVIKEINNYNSTGIKADELEFLKSAIGQSDARKYETAGQKAAILDQIMYYNLPMNYLDQQNKILNSFTKKEADVLAKKYIDLKNMNMVIAGDLEKIKPTLEKLGYTVIELSAEELLK
jgi:zinc protease